MSLRCDVVGEPQPTVVWLQNNTALRQTHRKNVRENDMMVTEVQREDGGVYVCQVYNGVGGRQRKTFNVEIIGENGLLILTTHPNNGRLVSHDV